MPRKHARRSTTTNHGGKRYKGNFFARKQKAMDNANILTTISFECPCEPHCLWQAANILPDMLQFVEDLRAGRFTGPNGHATGTQTRFAIFLFNGPNVEIHPGV